MIIGVDFDNTIAYTDSAGVQRPVPGAIEKLSELISAGHRIVLITSRDNTGIITAKLWLESHGISLLGVNRSPLDSDARSKPKCHLYIDDGAIGCPLTRTDEGLPIADWGKINQLLAAYV